MRACASSPSTYGGCAVASRSSHRGAPRTVWDDDSTVHCTDGTAGRPAVASPHCSDPAALVPYVYVPPVSRRAFIPPIGKCTLLPDRIGVDLARPGPAGRRILHLDRGPYLDGDVPAGTPAGWYVEHAARGRRRRYLRVRTRPRGDPWSMHQRSRTCAKRTTIESLKQRRVGASHERKRCVCVCARARAWDGDCACTARTDVRTCRAGWPAGRRVVALLSAVPRGRPARAFILAMGKCTLLDRVEISPGPGRS